MVQFTVYAISGFAVLWLNLMMWGFTAGPVNATPYLALVGALTLFTVAPGIALFVPRIAACLALVAAALIIPWPLFVWFKEHNLSGLAMFGTPPLIVAGLAAFHIWQTRRENWLKLRTTPLWAVRLAVAILPLIALALLFNASLVLELVFRYPFS